MGLSRSIVYEFIYPNLFAIVWLANSSVPIFYYQLMNTGTGKL